MDMRILITNDDSINAQAIVPLAQWARRFGDVTVVAPKFEQSGKSHSIEIFKPFEVKKLWEEEGFRGYSLDSTPADCVRSAYYYLHDDFDLVLSGVNNGYNLGEDILYSGTVGAASEGVLCGKKAIALSTKRGLFEDFEKQLENTIRYIIDNKLLDVNDLWNVNICDEPKGIKYTLQGCTNFDAYYEEVGEDLIFSRGGPDHAREKDRFGSDVNAIYHHYISITPLCVDRTNYNVLNKVIK
jgi:5'-nucleotidase